jgi:hypothetical protein
VRFPSPRYIKHISATLIYAVCSEPEEEGNLDGVMHQYTTMPSGKPFKSDLVFWCTGTTPNTGFLKKHFGDFLTPNGLVKTNEFFQLGSEGRWSRIFAVGDCTAWRVRLNDDQAAVQSCPLTFHPRAGNQNGRTSSCTFKYRCRQHIGVGPRLQLKKSVFGSCIRQRPA